MIFETHANEQVELASHVSTLLAQTCEASVLDWARPIHEDPKEDNL